MFTKTKYDKAGEYRRERDVAFALSDTSDPIERRFYGRTGEEESGWQLLFYRWGASFGLRFFPLLLTLLRSSHLSSATRIAFKMY